MAESNVSVSYRPATAEDEPFLRQVFESTRGDLLVLPPPIMEMQFYARKAWYRTAFPNAEHWIVLADDLPAGQLIVEDRESIHLIDISLLTELRNRGIGTGVVRQLISRGKPVTLMVRLENPARRLYERLGFQEVSRDELHATMKYGL